MQINYFPLRTASQWLAEHVTSHSRYVHLWLSGRVPVLFLSTLYCSTVVAFLTWSGGSFQDGMAQFIKKLFLSGQFLTN
ncbi:hypothetical protein BpHYR1_005697 [Brachionus plicatilis]|uniref:Uncharacterized protein n=1 Tax=Brachionus plicatilis TaxID=10195 RepID=A0A3M7PXB2_BRAPC|nr:hypothetical protein BpHYR1_005697 [Brachionus plicatilis]